MVMQTAVPIQSRARGALSRSPIYELRHLEVIEIGGCIVLQGVVSSFYHKQLAQEVVRAVCSGISVRNAVQVE